MATSQEAQADKAETAPVQAKTIDEVSKEYGKQAEAVKGVYTAGQDVSQFSRAFNYAWNIGNAGGSLSGLMKSDMVSYLTEDQRKLAFNIGSDAASISAKETAKGIVPNGKTGRRKGAVQGVGVTLDDLTKTFNDTQHKAYKILQFYAQATGIDIVLYKSEADNRGEFTDAQGKFSRSEDKIYIDVNAGLSSVSDTDTLSKYTMVRTFAHEFTHFIEKWNPVEYNEFRKAVFDCIEERGESVTDLIETKIAKNDGMSYDIASREVVAEAMTDILPDTHFAQSLLENHRNIFEKLLAKLKEFISDLRSYFDSLVKNPSREANILKDSVGETVSYVSDIVKAYDALAEKAVENYQSANAVEENVSTTEQEEKAHGISKGINDGRRTETNIEFVERNDGGVFTVIERGEIRFAYKRIQPGSYSGRVKQIVEEAEGYGIKVIVHSGIEVNKNGFTTNTASQAATLVGDAIYVNNDLTKEPAETFGHEAFHFWRKTELRDIYTEILQDNIVFSSNAFAEFSSNVSNSYLGYNVEIDDPNWKLLTEELYAYITGIIHSGDPDNVVRPFLRDYEKVKNAWNNFLESHLSQEASRIDDQKQSSSASEGKKAVSKYGYSIVPNEQYEGSVDILFSEKPSDAVRQVLKDNKFRWNGKRKAWYGYKSAEKISALLDKAFEAEAEQDFPEMPKDFYERHKADGLTDDEIMNVWKGNVRQINKFKQERLHGKQEREITSSTYIRAQNRLNKRVASFVGSGLTGSGYITARNASGGKTVVAEVSHGSVIEESADNKPVSKPASASKLRKAADGMQKSIDDKFRDRLTNTAKRAREAASQTEQGEKLKTVQATLRNIADAQENGKTVRLSSVENKAQVETLIKLLVRARYNRNRNNIDKKTSDTPYNTDDVRYAELPGKEMSVYLFKEAADAVRGKTGFKRICDRLDRAVLYANSDSMVKLTDQLKDDLQKVAAKFTITRADYFNDCISEAKRMQKIGIQTDDDLRATLSEFLEYYPSGKIDSKEKRIAEKERSLIGTKISGYFPTPKSLVSRMLDEAGIKPGDKVLEPSAGKGNIADEIKSSYPENDLDVAEYNSTLSDILSEKGYNIVGDDFLSLNTKYDRIIMNPPFENLQDVDHVKHAYDLLNAGGRIVAIMSESPFFRADKKSSEFRDWLDDVGGVSEKLPEGSFKNSERSTGVNTRLVIIDKGKNQEQSRAYLKSNEEAEKFREEIDEWDRNGRSENRSFILGSTGDILQGLGAIDNDIYMNGNKIEKILQDHPEMTIDEIKKIPEIIDDPVLVLKSRNISGSPQNTRLVMYSLIKAKNGLPILSVLDLRPVENKIVVDDMQKITSAYTKTMHPEQFIRNSDVLYAEKKRTAQLLRSIGFKMPIELQKNGYIGSISYNKRNVNISGEKFSDVFMESADQEQERVKSYTDREVLEMAASQITDLSDAEENSLDIFKDRLKKLRALEDQRKELGSLYREQQFGAGTVNRAEAKKTKARMDKLDTEIQKAESDVLSAEDKSVLKRVLQKARGVVESQVREHGNEILKRYRDRRNDSDLIRKYKERIQADVSDLTSWIQHPGNKNTLKHVPDALKSSVIPFLTSIDMMSKRQIRGGEATKADEKFAAQMESVKAAIKDEAKAANEYGQYSDLPEGFGEKLEAFISTVRSLTETYKGDYVINKMTAQELKTLSGVIKNLKAYIKQFNRFHVNAMFAHIDDAGNDSIRFMEGLSKAKHAGAVSNFLMWQQMRPAYAFERFGEGGKSIYDELRRGQAKLAFNTKQIKDFSDSVYTSEQVNAWETEIKEFTLGNDVVKVPVSYVMGLYELSKRKHAMDHLLCGGLRIATYNNGKEKISDTGHILTQQDNCLHWNRKDFKH